MRYPIIISILLLAVLDAEARPYRALHARTPRATSAGKLELGLRYDGLLLGTGRSFDPGNFHQLAGTVRWGAMDVLELELEVPGILFPDTVSSPNSELAFGDVRLAAQLSLVREGPARMGFYFGLAAPTGPDANDLLPPFFHDGNLDLEGLLLLEIAPGETFRFIGDVGFQRHGNRNRGDLEDFNVPNAIRYDLALGINLGPHSLLLLELSGRHFIFPEITPLWVDNDDIVELAPGFRLETSPGLVLELGAGFAVVRATESIYQYRVLAGFTYELGS